MCVPPFYRFIWAFHINYPLLERIETLNFNECKAFEYLKLFIMNMIQSTSNRLNIVKKLIIT
jgi:hypothetical protein